MNSTFMGIEIGKKGLMSHQQALNVTGHNISNAENKEYSRQRAIITAADPLYNPSLNRANTPGQIGQGSTILAVERVRDFFIDNRMIAEENTMGFWQTRSGFIKQVEAVYNEPSDQSIRSKMDALWSAWQELSKYPEEKSTREVVKERAIQLANEIKSVHRQLQALRGNANNQIAFKVDQINGFAHNIKELNERITKSEALGDNPNDLLDKRDALVEKLSKIVNISVERGDHDEFMVYIGSQTIVQGNIMRPLKVVQNPDNDGMNEVLWKKTEGDVTIKGGELAGLIDVRDHILRDNINDVNALALNITDMVNEVHRDGFGLRGETNISFFRHLNMSDDSDGNVDLNNDGVLDVTALFRVSGRNKVDPTAPIGIRGTLTFARNDKGDAPALIDYDKSDTVNSVIKKINDAKLGVSAYLDHNGHFAIKATVAKDSTKKNFMIRHMEDSGQFLVGLTGVLKESGQNGAFDYRRVNDIRKFLPSREHITMTPKMNPAGSMAISKEIANDIDRIAAAKGRDVGGTGDFNKSDGVGDGTNALAIAGLRHKEAMVDSKATFSEFYTSLIAKIGSQGEEAQNRIESQTVVLKNLNNMRESVSGINLDEEMSNMVAFQHGYNAAARVITTMDEMLETIINRMGV